MAYGLSNTLKKEQCKIRGCLFENRQTVNSCLAITFRKKKEWLYITVKTFIITYRTHSE